MKERKSILLLEDNEGHARLIERALAKSRGGYVVAWVTSVAEALARLAAGDVQLVLADLTLPDSSGSETVAALRAQQRDLPIVVLTSLADDDMALAVLDHGAQDYLVKDDATPENLDRAMRYAIQRQQHCAQIERLLAELQAARDLLERKNRRLGKLYRTAHRFVDNVSHEFRTPLTVIKEYASLVQDGLLGAVNPEQVRFLDVVGDRADDLNHMVDDMLDVSKLEAGILGMHRVNARVDEIVEHVRVGLERKALLRGVTLHIALEPNLPDVFCDAEKAGRVIVNLVVNAIKFVSTSGDVWLWARPGTEGDEVLVGVSDNGPGIHPDDLEAIFQRFKQIGSHARSSTKGFGLGLSIARELVALNLGQMWVESRLGAGSTFSFSLPVGVPARILERYLHRIAVGGDEVSVVQARISEACGPGLVDEVENFLSNQLRRNDLLLRTAAEAWLVVLPCPEGDVGKFLARVRKAIGSENRNRAGAPLPDLVMEWQGTWEASQAAEVLEHFQILDPS